MLSVRKPQQQQQSSLVTEGHAFAVGERIEVNIMRTARDHTRSVYTVRFESRSESGVVRSRIRKWDADTTVEVSDTLEAGEKVYVKSRTKEKWREAHIEAPADWVAATVKCVRDSDSLLARRIIFQHYHLTMLQQITFLAEKLDQQAQRLTITKDANAQEQPPVRPLEIVNQAIHRLTTAQDKVKKFVSALRHYQSQPKGRKNVPPQFSKDLFTVCHRLARDKALRPRVLELKKAFVVYQL